MIIQTPQAVYEGRTALQLFSVGQIIKANLKNRIGIKELDDIMELFYHGTINNVINHHPEFGIFTQHYKSNQLQIMLYPFRVCETRKEIYFIDFDDKFCKKNRMMMPRLAEERIINELKENYTEYIDQLRNGGKN